MSYLILKPKTKKEEQVFIELAHLLKVHIEKSEAEALADIRERKEEVISWAKAQDKKMRRGKAKLTNDEIVAIVKENRLKTKARRVNASIRKGKKPSLSEISSIVRKVRKENKSNHL